MSCTVNSGTQGDATRSEPTKQDSASLLRWLVRKQAFSVAKRQILLHNWLHRRTSVKQVKPVRIDFGREKMISICTRTKSWQSTKCARQDHANATSNLLSLHYQAQAKALILLNKEMTLRETTAKLIIFKERRESLMIEHSLRISKLFQDLTIQLTTQWKIRYKPKKRERP